MLQDTCKRLKLDQEQKDIYNQFVASKNDETFMINPKYDHKKIKKYFVMKYRTLILSFLADSMFHLSTILFGNWHSKFSCNFGELKIWYDSRCKVAKAASSTWSELLVKLQQTPEENEIQLRKYQVCCSLLIVGPILTNPLMPSMHRSVVEVPQQVGSPDQQAEAISKKKPKGFEKELVDNFLITPFVNLLLNLCTFTP